MLVAGTAAFAAASLGSALAPSAGVDVATRAVEGLAAAFVVPMTLAMLTSVFPAGPPRTRAFSVWGGISAAAGTLGLVVGGALVSAAGWRWIFLINIPVGLIVIVAALRVLPADSPRRGEKQSYMDRLVGRIIMGCIFQAVLVSSGRYSGIFSHPPVALARARLRSFRAPSSGGRHRPIASYRRWWLRGEDASLLRRCRLSGPFVTGPGHLPSLKYFRHRSAELGLSPLQT